MRLLMWSAAGALACALALVYGTAESAPWLAGCAAVLLTAAAVMLSRRNLRLRPAAAGLLALSIGMLLLTGRFALCMRQAARAEQALCGKTAVRTFRLTGLPETSGNGWRMDVRVLDADGHAFSGVSARVYVYDAQAAELHPGDMFTARIRLNSTLHTSAGRSLAARGCFLRGTAQNVCRTAEHTRPVSTMPLRLRRLFLSRADALFRDGAPMMRALLLGDRSGIDDSFSSAVSDAGVAHVFAVSGMHLSFLVGAALYLAHGRKRLSRMTIALVWLFAAIAGFPPSIVRAAVMQSAVLAAPLFGRESDSLTGLSGGLVLLLLWNPYAVADMGLQLSFLSVLGLLTVGATMHRRLALRLARLAHWPAIPRRLFAAAGESAAATVSAQLFTLPLMVLYFGRISVVSIFSNLLLLWLISLIFLLGWGALLLSLIWLPLGQAAAWPAVWGIRCFAAAVRTIAGAPFAVIGTDSIWMKAWVVLLCLLAGAWFVWRRRLVRILIACSGCAALIAALLLARRAEIRSFSVAALAVGHGQCIVVTYGGSTVVIDCGSTRSDAGSTLRAHLQSRNLPDIDVLALTVNTPHHANGIPTILSGVKTLLLSERNGDEALAASLRAAAEQAGTDVQAIRVDTVVPAGKLTVTAVVSRDARREHRGALAVLVSCERGSVAVLGDVSDRTLAVLRKDKRFLNVNAVVCAGHSINFSEQSAFLMKSAAKYVIISSKDQAQEPLDSTPVYHTAEGAVRLRLG